MNDANPYLTGLLRAIRDTDPDSFVQQVYGLISEYDLDNLNESKFYTLRDRYNTGHDPVVLYTLLLFAINSLFRFNSRGGI